MKWIIGCLTVLVVGCASQPRDQRPARSEVVCSFEMGLDFGRRVEAYDNSCTATTEESFLTGYGIGRKTAWVTNEAKAAEADLFCLQKEYDLKFDNTFSPVHVYLPTEGDSIKLNTPAGCAFDTFRSTIGLKGDINRAKQKLKGANSKLERLQALQHEISMDPSKAKQAIAAYKRSTPTDALDTGAFDVDLRWRDYVAQKQGFEHLSSQEQGMVYREVYRKPELENDVLKGAFLYGFGIGHLRQGRFASRGWLYAVFDTLVIATSAYGAATHQVGLALPVFVFGGAGSRIVQYVDVYNYNLDHGIDIQNLRTERSSKAIMAQLYQAEF